MRAHEFKRRRLQRPDPAKAGIPRAMPSPTPGRAMALLGLLVASMRPTAALSSGLDWLIEAAGRFSVDSFGKSAGFSVPGGFGKPAGFASEPGDSPVLDVLDTQIEAPSVANLDRTLLGVQPAFFYKGEDYTAGTLPAEVGGAAGLLTETGAGSLSAAGSPLMGSDAAIAFDGTNTLDAADNTFADITTEHIVVELTFKYDSTISNGSLLGKRLTTGTNPGYLIRDNGSSAVQLSMDNGATFRSVTSPVLTHGAWYHLIWFMHRTGSGICYANTLAGSATNISAAAGSLTCAYPFKLGWGHQAAASGQYTVGHVAMWHPTLTTHLHPTTAAQRFRALTGFRPQISAAGRDTAPVTFARNSNATLEKYNETTAAVELYTVGPHWMRCERWLDGDGDVITGYRAELAGTNELVESRTLGTTWLLRGAAAATNATAETTGPWGDYNASLVAGIGALGANDIRQILANGTISSSGPVAVGCWFKRKSTTGTIEIINTRGTALGQWVVDVSACPDAWVRLDYASPYVSVTNAFTADVAGAVGMNVNATTGTVDAYFGNCQMEDTGGYKPSSDIITAAAAATRVKDEVEPDITGAGVGAQGAIILDVCQRSVDVGTATTLIDVSDAGATNRVRIDQIAAGDVAQAVLGTTGSVTGTTDLADGSVHRVGVTWKAGRLELWVDGSMEGTVDTSFTTPGAMTQCALGMNYSNALQPASPTNLRRARLYRRFQHNMASLTGGLS